jgi:hypothetical protein
VTDIAQLGVEIKTADVTRARRELDGLTASGRAAEGMAGALASGFRTTALGAAAVVAAAAGAAFAVDRLIKSVGNYQDIAERTGGSAEGWASIRTAADVAGVSIDSVAESANRLTRNLSMVNEESDATQRALRAIGLSAQELREQSPDEQIRTVAKALAQFEDQAGKAAVVQALYGRGGAALLPVLKELGNEQQRLTFLTREQIEAADEYADRQARVASELSQLAQVAAVQAAPALLALMNAASEVAQEMIGLEDAVDGLGRNDGIAEFARTGVEAFGVVISAGQVVSRTLEGIGKNLGGLAAVASAVARGEFAQARAILREMDAANADIAQREFFITKLQRSLDRAPDEYSNEGRNRRRALDFRAPDEKNKAARKTVDEFARERASLEERYALMGVNSEAERLLTQIALGRFDKTKPAQQQELVSLARAVDARRAEIDALAEEARYREQVSSFIARQNAVAQAEVDRLIEGNQALREEIELLGATDEAKTAVEKARVRSIRTLKEEQFVMRANAGETEEQLSQLRQEIELLREREELIGLRGATQAGVALRDGMDRSSEQIGNNLADQIEQGILEGSRRGLDLMDIFLQELKAQFAKTVLRPLIQPIANDANSLIGDILGSIVGAFTGSSVPGGSYDYRGTTLPDSLRGGRRAGGTTQRGGLYEVNEEGPELYREGGKTYLMSGGGMVAPARSMPASGQSAPVFNLKFENAPQVESTQRRRNQSGGEDVLVRFVKEIARSTMDEDMSGNSGSAGSMSRRFGLNPAMGTMR